MVIYVTQNVLVNVLVAILDELAINQLKCETCSRKEKQLHSLIWSALKCAAGFPVGTIQNGHNHCLRITETKKMDVKY